MPKYYAVKVGKKPGIYSSWSECKKQVDGFSGATYKSFSSLKEAEDFLAFKLESTKIIENDTNSKQTILRVYVDGSYSKEYQVYSYGCVLLNEKLDKIQYLSGSGNDKNLVDLWNVAGELLGAIKAIEFAYENKYDKVLIYHDYEGIAKWAIGEWKAKKNGTKTYFEFIKEYKDKIKIEFSKVKAHSGVYYNEEADRLAKEAFLTYVNSLQKSSSIEEAAEISVEEKIFHDIMSNDDKGKKAFMVLTGNYVITEAKINKLAKTIWKSKGKKIGDILNISSILDTKNSVLSLEITTKEQEVNYSFKTS